MLAARYDKAPENEWKYKYNKDLSHQRHERQGVFLIL